MKDLIEEMKTQLEVLLPGSENDQDIAETKSLIKKAEEATAGHLLPMDDDLKEILGMICFQCIPFCQIFRLDGRDIPSKAEAEQAYTIHWMLGHYLKTGKDWKASAESEVKEIKIRHYAKQAELAKQAAEEGKDTNG